MDTETAIEYAIISRKVGAQCEAIASARRHLAEIQQTLEGVVKGPPFGEAIEEAFAEVDGLGLNLPSETKRERAMEMALAPFQGTSRARLLKLLEAAETEGEAVALRWLIGELEHVEDVAPEEVEAAPPTQ
jgi:hypothetical protein